MVKKWIVFGLLVSLVGFAAIIYGCGQAQQGTPSTTTQAVTISGTVAASQSDLAQLGVSTLAVKASNVEDLVARGIPESSIKAAGLVPLTAGGTIIKVGTLNADGSITQVASATVGPDGDYSVQVLDYDLTKAYCGIVTKTVANKTLEMKNIYPRPTNKEIKGSDAGISPQTTVVFQMIIDNVVMVLESANVDPETIANVKESIITTVNNLISSGVLTVTAVKDSSNTSGATKDAAKQAATNDIIAQKIDAVKGATQLKATTDITSATAAIKTILQGLMNGDPRGAPEEMIKAFAQKYLDGVTIKASAIAPAMNKSMFNMQTQQPVSGSFTTSQITTQIQNMLQGILGGKAADAPANIRYVVELAFPKATWASATISGDTTFTVPQAILLVGISEKLAHDAGYGINHSKLAAELGLIGSEFSAVKILHAEVIIKTVEDFSSIQPGQEPAKVRALEVFAEFGNMVNMSTNLTGYTATLTYPTASGNKTVSLSENQFFANAASAKSIRAMEGDQMGPPPGMKMVRLDPWNSQTRVTDFVAGTATITLKNASGTTIDTKSLTIPNIDLTFALVTIDVPKQAWLDNIANMTKFDLNTTPTFNWTSGTLPSVGSGYRLAYAINVIKGTISSQNGHTNFQPNWENASDRIVDSWEKQNFPPTESNETFKFTVPTTLAAAGVYELGVGIVAIDKATGFPAAEGPHRGTLFIVGEISQAITDTTAKQEFQQEFVEINISTKDLILEGKVHADILSDNRFSGGTLLVGLVKEGYDPSTGFSQSLVSAPVPLTAVAGQTYKTFSLPVSGSVFGTNYGQYAVMLFNDADGGSDLDANEFRERSTKSIEHQQWGTKVFWPGGGGELANSQGAFNILPWGTSF